MTEMLKKGRMQGRRAVAMVLLLSMLSGYLPAPAAARAASAYAALNGAQVLVDGMRRTDIGSVTYSRESDGDYEIDASSQRVRVGMEEEIAFTGSISAPQGETPRSRAAILSASLARADRSMMGIRELWRTKSSRLMPSLSGRPRSRIIRSGR